jgi:hypothetical protein
MRINSLFAATSARLTVVGIDATLRTAALYPSRPGIGLVVVCTDTGRRLACSANRISSDIYPGQARPIHPWTD